MTLIVNGRPQELPAGETLAQVISRFTDRNSGVAVAVNHTVVPRHAWSTTSLSDGDHVELLTAVQGG